MKEYNPTRIEKKWQAYWERKKLNQAKEKVTSSATRRGGGKFYALIEFPYPSGDGLHVGHIRSNTAMDIIARKRRAEGYEVLYPMGWDAFGLPTENFALKTGIHPAVVTKKNTANFRRQLKALGFSFDWSREINTTDPEYYKWTQWIFLKFLEKGLAYKKRMAINWCPKDKTGLANEEVLTRSTSSGQVGVCERCGTPVEKREKEQWMLAITKYADRLDKDLDTVDFQERIKIQQRNWIGRSEGALISFQLSDSRFQNEKKLEARSQKLEAISVFTTRADTLFGATYLVLAPEHPLVSKIENQNQITNKDEVVRYIVQTKKKSEIERTTETKEKTGVELKGVKAINPANGEEIPIWVADYVLVDYGTGAIMAVPAHDERDFEFAKKYGLPIKTVVEPRFKKESGSDAVRKDLPLIQRDAVVCVVKHWSEDKYLCLRWKNVDWSGFVTGGIDGDSPVDAGKREILEETGYMHARFIRELGQVVNVQFYHVLKKENRWARFQSLYFELTDGEQTDVSEKEKSIHDIHWVSRADVDKFLSVPDMKLIWHRVFDAEKSFVDEGVLANSGKFSGMSSVEAKKKITEFVGGEIVTTYKLRDWIFSRQRYWGEPIPLVFCEDCKKRVENHESGVMNYEYSEGEKLNPGWIAVPEKDLPVKLPNVKNYKPTDSGESPLAAVSKWVNVKCPKCKGKVKRETDTMPNWAGSSWYYLAYAMHSKLFPKSKVKGQWSNVLLETWLPVDWYNGGMEHTTLHLLYSRFWHKFLFDLGLVPTNEPYAKRTSHGLILAEGGVKMSKSKGNVVNPDSLIKTFGADTLRLYEMFMGPFDQHIAWSTESMVGPRRFLEKTWKLADRFKIQDSRIMNKAPNLESKTMNHESILLHKTVKKVSEDIEAMRFNTAVSSLMILLNEFEKSSDIQKSQYEIFLRLLAPFAPHIAEELWSLLGHGNSIHLEPWPTYDPVLVGHGTGVLVIQVNGKVRSNIKTGKELSESEAKDKALALPEIQKWITGKMIKKIIYVKGRLINIVI
ncbi:MAG: class I tRNA ligase family protein [bacterium]|nr:class I tRNA ligase family protein [bacterium]